MLGFQTKAAEVLTTDGRRVTVAEPIQFNAIDGRQYVIPRGAVSDGCSTPREIWPFLPPFGPYWLAALLHDCAYQNTLLLVDEADLSQRKAALSRDECDNLFKEAMESLDVDAGTVEKIYLGVHEFGWLAFKEDRS